MSKTNVEKVTHLMDFSKHGGLMQMFIIQAICYYAEAVGELTEAEWKTNIIHFPSWQGCAKEALEVFEPKEKAE